MKITPLVLALSLGCAGAAMAQPDAPAKGNAPLKPAHTVNDGGARKGANSFTEGQAREHILKSGYESVTGLAKGSDGVWRGTAVKAGVSSQVAMDFKGNVTDAGGAPVHKASAHHMTHAASTAPAPAADGAAMSGDAAMGAGGAAMGGAAMGAGGATTTTTEHKTTTSSMHHRHHRHHRHHAATGATGAAKSGVDKNNNGISDREDRARAN